MTNSFIRIFRTFDFYKSVVLAMAILVVIIISVRLWSIDVGLSIATGIFICAPANVPGSTKHRIRGILVAILLGVIVTVIINSVADSLWMLVAALGALIFLISYISVYGFRASLVSFSALLAIILSFAHPHTGTGIWLHAGLMSAGGLWYLLLSQLSHILIYKKQTEQLMAECMSVTATYLRTRGELALAGKDNLDLQKRLFDLQTDLNAKHETLREILLSTRRTSGQSNFNRRQVLILIELIDILELAMANPGNFGKIQTGFEKYPGSSKVLTNLIIEMANQLENLSGVMGNDEPFGTNESINRLLKLAEKELAGNRVGINSSEAREDTLMLRNVYLYLQKQAQKIEVIRKVMQNLLGKDQKGVQGSVAEKFITQQDYDWKTLSANLSFRSPIFRHSLRLTVTVLAGFFLGIAFSVQNAYWILLTIIVIMRPGYGLTKQRSKQRTYGTLIGGIIAVGVVLLTQNQYIYGVLATVTFILAFALVQKNYKSAAIFITLSIVLIYALLEPDVMRVIQFRVLDTLAGAALAVVANAFLWPSWEYLNIQALIEETISANITYLHEINKYYHHKDKKDPSYKLSRKNAFLAIGNLNAAFQRMTQEPKSRQKDLARIYEVVVLNHTFLSLAAALGAYIRHHQTTEASRHFETYIAGISNNLEVALNNPGKREIPAGQFKAEINEAQQYLETIYQKLSAYYSTDAAEDRLSEPPEQLQEVKIISDQLKWLYTISENLKHAVMAVNSFHK